MRKIFILFILSIISNSAYCACNMTKCSDLMSNMYNARATISNVLNLTDDQKKCKETIDKKFQKEAEIKFDKYEQEKYVLKNLQKHGASDDAINKQQKVIANIEKEFLKMNENYDKEFKSILDNQQKNKLNSVRKMENKALKICKSKKALYERDKNLKPFGIR